MKTGRNDLCLCGSGKKYKRCCFSAEKLRERQRAADAATSAPPDLFIDDEAWELDQLSNSVVDLLDEGRLDEAEAACRELQRRYPDLIDWLDRTAMLYEKRGDKKMAAEYYRRCLQFTFDQPEYFDNESRAWMRAKIVELDPENATAAGHPSATR